MADLKEVWFIEWRGGGLRHATFRPLSKERVFPTSGLRIRALLWRMRKVGKCVPDVGSMGNIQIICDAILVTAFAPGKYLFEYFYPLFWVYFRIFFIINIWICRNAV